MRRALWLSALMIAVLASVPALAQVPPPQQPDRDYIIGPEDLLEIQVWGNKDLNQMVFVRPDGRTSLPLVGEIGVAGKTVQQLQDHLTNVYEKTVKGAVVTVIVKEIRSRPVYFVGGFGKPGVMQLTRELTWSGGLWPMPIPRRASSFAGTSGSRSTSIGWSSAGI